jgi:hypothetical protein
MRRRLLRTWLRIPVSIISH